MYVCQYYKIKICMYYLKSIIHDNKHTETTDNTIKILFTIHNYLTFAASYMYISDATTEARVVAMYSC